MQTVLAKRVSKALDRFDEETHVGDDAFDAVDDDTLLILLPLIPERRESVAWGFMRWLAAHFANVGVRS